MKKKKQPEKKKKKGTKFYLIGSAIILAVLAIGVYNNSKNPIAHIVQDYIVKKQEIYDLLGEIKEIKGAPSSQFLKTDKSYNLSLQLVGKYTTGTLNAQAQHKNNQWLLSQITLRVGNKLHRLSPLYVTGLSYHEASDKAKTKAKPVFAPGKDIYIKTQLKGAHASSQKTNITQSLSVFDSNRNLLAKKNNVANFNSDNNASSPLDDTIHFTTKISNLPPGSYYLQFAFKDKASSLQESHWRKIQIQKPSQNVYVKSVQFYANKSMTTKKKEKVFTTDEGIFVRMFLDGFLASNNTIDGEVDLKIENSLGNTVAFKPRFVTINKTQDKNKTLYVDGHLKLNEPDVYFLSFRIKDNISRSHIIHDEKIVVQFATIENEEKVESEKL